MLSLSLDRRKRNHRYDSTRLASVESSISPESKPTCTMTFALHSRISKSRSLRCRFESINKVRTELFSSCSITVTRLGDEPRGGSHTHTQTHTHTGGRGGVRGYGAGSSPDPEGDGATRVAAAWRGSLSAQTYVWYGAVHGWSYTTRQTISSLPSQWSAKTKRTWCWLDKANGGQGPGFTLLGVVVRSSTVWTLAGGMVSVIAGAAMSVMIDMESTTTVSTGSFGA